MVITQARKVELLRLKPPMFESTFFVKLTTIENFLAF
jgi:hypothetical protein